MKSEKGFTLLELIVVVSIIAILAAFALPDFMAWMRSAKYRDQANNIFTALNKARSYAISSNREHRVEFQVAANRYRIMQGNLYSGSGSWTPVGGWVAIPSTVALRSTDACDNSADFSFEFNPNGSGQAGHICVLAADAGNSVKFKIGVVSTTGRATIEH